MSRQKSVLSLSTESEPGRWNSFVSSSPCGHLLQSWEWGSFKKELGWLVERIGVERNGHLVAGAQMLLRRLPLLPLTIAYIPKGPLFDIDDEESIALLMPALHEAARRRHAVLLKIEPNFLDSADAHAALRQNGFRPSTLTNQPRSTIVVNLTGGEDAVLTNMHRKTRRRVRQAAREGVKIEHGGCQDLGFFYQVLRSTARRKDFAIHGRVFYEQAWKAFQATGAAGLLLARYEGEIVAAKMVFAFADKSMHLWGGTTPKGRAVYASYLLQWEAIRWAIARGCNCCDLWGIPDSVGEMQKCGQEIPKEDTGGLWGVYMFKRGYGGRTEYYVGAYDYPYRPLMHSAIQLLTHSSSVAALSRLIERSTQDHSDNSSG